MTISVLMSVYRSEQPEYLDEALASVWTAQTLKPQQIILVEDGTLTDGLYAVIDKWSRDLGDKLLILKNKQKNTNGYFTLRGTATGDCFNELKYISVSYSPDGDAKVEKLMFDDSGTPLNASVKYTPEENRIAIKWTEEIREYNGRMETFPNGGNASFQFVNTAPYGFVLIDDENTVYSYQAEADPAFFESDTEK